jgi:thiamine biosynthesis lipoprotein
LSRAAPVAPPALTIYRTAALGTQAELVVTDPGSLVVAARILRDELDRIDALASRFRADSEISALHRAEGRRTGVSEGLFDAIRVSLAAAEATEGAVDPTVGGALCRLGYDRDFSKVAGGRSRRLPMARPVPGWRSVVLDERDRTVTLQPGTQLDLGATAKALAADRAAAAVHRATGSGVLVSLGGDIATAGAPAEGFSVGLQGGRPGLGPDGSVAIFSGGMATSGIDGRRWLLGDHSVHHIVDPASGHSATPVWWRVTVCAATCVGANTASTAAIVKGQDAVAWLGERHLPARLLAVDGTVTVVGGWPAEQVGTDGAER